VFVTLFETDPWPEDALEYARTFFGSTPRSEIEAAVAENTQLKADIQATEARIAEVQRLIREQD
jgi:hypothetical protein